MKPKYRDVFPRYSLVILMAVSLGLTGCEKTGNQTGDTIPGAVAPTPESPVGGDCSSIGGEECECPDGSSSCTNSDGVCECDEPLAKGPGPAAPPVVPPKFEPPPRPNDSVQRFDDLVVGKPRTHWIDTWGPADSKTEFPMKRGVLEYQIELKNVFRDDDPETERVQIHEDTWDEDGYTFVLWSFRKSDDEPWQAVQAMGYMDGIEF